MNSEKYFNILEREVNKIYSVAEEAKKKGLDPSKEIESPLAMTMAAKVEGLISTVYPQMKDSGISQRILKLEEEHGKLDPAVAFKIAEEIAKQKFCKFPSLLEAIDGGIRIGFAYLTLGVVSSPIEGYTRLKLGKTREGKEYFVAYFSGPIRSAGTTASCVALMLIDYLREMFGYAKYDPTEEEIKRYFVENYDYHDRITNLQYMPTQEEAEFLASKIPIQIAGEPTEKLEVSNYKNLERVSTNFLRGGMCLIFSEGLAQKAKKGYRLLKAVKAKGFQSTGWDFLEDYIELHEKREVGKTSDSPTYIKDLVAGRPVFGHPSESGAFRFRYGRGRTSGFSAISISPATMGITDDFIAIGTQLKIEKPTKGCVVTSCDTIEGPIVRLKNGSVKQIRTYEEAKNIYKEVEEIIYLGDMLFPFSDVVNRNSNLINPGYVEEWWELELREKNPELEKEVKGKDVLIEKAIEISNKTGVPLYPKHIFYWNEITNEQFFSLIDWLKKANFDDKIILHYSKTDQEKHSSGKRALELLGVEHEVTIEHVVINEKNSKALFANLGLDFSILQGGDLKDVLKEEQYVFEKPVLEIVNNLAKHEIKDKSGEFIGTRMGRPEKAKLRKLTGSPNVLFPIGKEGGRLRSVHAAVEVGKVWSAFPINHCEKCNKETIYPKCEVCEEETKQKFYFYNTKEKSFKKKLEGEEREGTPYCNQEIDVKHYFKKAVEKLGLIDSEIPPLIKGVRGTSSGDHIPEHLAKGILRARRGLQVNKDGTIRFDVTELPLTSFKPKEISVNVEKLRELGYTRDVYGKELVNEDQILELMPHDILLPSSPLSPDERADDVFVKICNFVDDELERFYGMKPFYNVKKREDLVGKLGVCMAPHNCAGVICRFIGFSNVLGMLASPYMHAAIRRDCDGDEAAIMLLGDVLLNFSRKFLPSHRGGTQDAPLVLNAKINAGEVDDQILDFEYITEHPLELYQLAEQGKHSSEVKINLVKDILKRNEDPFQGVGFTHDTSDFNKGVSCSAYKTLATMQEKVEHQMGLVEKIRAANTRATAKLIINRHFLKDLRGNLRGFSQQKFRCVACNEILRRTPLTGNCPRCRGKIIFTINEGGIKKYLEPALSLAKQYNLSTYVQQNLELTKRFIDSVFGKEKEKQEELSQWFG